MPQRKYSLTELDEMRYLIWERAQLIRGWSLKEQRVEDILRTLMLNGTEPEELRAEVQELEKLRISEVSR